MTPFERDILTGRNYVGRRIDMKPHLRPMPRLRLMQTENTERTCRVCHGVNFGNGTIINDHSNGLMDREKCPACMGSRIMPKTEVRR